MTGVSARAAKDEVDASIRRAFVYAGYATSLTAPCMRRARAL